MSKDIELFPDDHSGNHERIAKLLEDQAERERKLMAMVEDLQRKMDQINNSLPLTEEERAKNRMIRMYSTKGIAAPFFHPYTKRMEK